MGKYQTYCDFAGTYCRTKIKNRCALLVKKGEIKRCAIEELIGVTMNKHTRFKNPRVTPSAYHKTYERGG